MNTVELNAQKRSVLGKKVASIRKEGFIPAVIYGHGFESTPVQVSRKDFERVYAEAGETTVVQLLLEGKKYPVIIKEVAQHPVGDTMLHVDFHKVRLDEKISASIPLNFVGESDAAKAGGVLLKNMTELEVEGFPQDLPHAIDVDLSVLAEIGQHIMVSDLKVGSKLTVKAEAESIVAMVQAPAEEEVLEAAPSIEDVEVDSGKGKDEVAEEPSEE